MIDLLYLLLLLSPLGSLVVTFFKDVPSRISANKFERPDEDVDEGVESGGMEGAGWRGGCDLGGVGRVHVVIFVCVL